MIYSVRHKITQKNGESSLAVAHWKPSRSRGSRGEDKDGSRVAEHDLQVTKALSFFSWTPCSSCSCSWSCSSLFLRCSCCSWWLLELVAEKVLWLLWMGWSEVDGWVMVVDADRLVLWWCGGGFILPLAFLRWSGTRWRRGGSFPFLSLAHSAHGVFPTLSPFCLFPFLACLISKLIFPPSLVQTCLNSFLSSLGTAAATLLHCFILNLENMS